VQRHAGRLPRDGGLVARAARFILISAPVLAATALAVPNAAAKSKGVTGPGCDPARLA
jgi:hypothetical protein